MVTGWKFPVSMGNLGVVLHGENTARPEKRTSGNSGDAGGSGSVRRADTLSGERWLIPRTQIKQIETMPNEPDPSDQRSEHEHARPPELRGKESEQSDSGNTVTHEHGRKTQVFRESAYSRFSGWWNRDRVLNLLTFLIFCTTVAYTVYSQRQWKTMQRQFDAFQTVEGASIGVGKYQGNLSDEEIGIPIENYGHIPSPKVSIFV
jgi:hypothetical protein